MGRFLIDNSAVVVYVIAALAFLVLFLQIILRARVQKKYYAVLASLGFFEDRKLSGRKVYLRHDSSVTISASVKINNKGRRDRFSFWVYGPSERSLSPVDLIVLAPQSRMQRFLLQNVPGYEQLKVPDYGYEIYYINRGQYMLNLVHSAVLEDLLQPLKFKGTLEIKTCNNRLELYVEQSPEILLQVNQIIEAMKKVHSYISPPVDDLEEDYLF